MVFSSAVFLFSFLPSVIILYFITPKKFKNLTLLICSLFFYWWGEPKYLILILAMIFSGYIHGLLINKFKNTPAEKFFLITCVVISLSLLGFFKYADFFISNINSISGADIPLLKLALPIGISFYTFQTLSYVIDVYRSDVKVQKNIVDLATYVVLFPQLIAGPIVRYSDIEIQLNSRTHSLEKFSSGVTRFVLGLAKKVLIANSLGQFCDIFRNSSEQSVAFYWLYAIAFTLQVYFDFSGYSDMAIGLGRIFGFELLENFNYPFISKSASEFWRRWHISLGSWFRDYVYIPLGGNRVNKPRWIFNIFFVWFLTGFWHGADWTFIIWGMIFAVFLTAEKLWLGDILKKIPSVFSRIYMLVLLLVSFVVFGSEGISGTIQDVSAMVGGSNLPLLSNETIYYFKSYLMIFVLAIIGGTPIVKKAVLKLKEKSVPRKIINILEPCSVLVLLAVITGYIVDGSFNPFLYFRF